MSARPQASSSDMRVSSRRAIDFTSVAEHRQLGEIKLHLVNISTQGFMVEGVPHIERGERVVLRLPVIGRIEGHLVWSLHDRAGFQFERILRADDFALMVLELRPTRRRQGS